MEEQLLTCRLSKKGVLSLPREVLTNGGVSIQILPWDTPSGKYRFELFKSSNKPSKTISIQKFLSNTYIKDKFKNLQNNISLVLPLYYHQVCDYWYGYF